MSDYALEILEKEFFFYKWKLEAVKRTMDEGHELIELPKLCEKRLRDLSNAITIINHFGSE